MATVEQLESALRKADAAGDADAAKQFATALRAQRSPMTDTLAALPITRFAMGAASPLIGAAQLGAKAGDWLNQQMGVSPIVSPLITKKLQEYDAAKQRGMKAAGTEGYDWMGLLGNLAPSTAIAGQVAKALPHATGALGKIGVGAAQGGAIGATTPTADPNFWQSKALQTGGGAAVGGAVPLVGTIGQTVSDVTSPLLDLVRKSGPANILNRYHRDIIGEQNLPPIKRALRGATQLVRGSKPTAAEAVAGLTEGSPLAAAQKITASTAGGPSSAFGTRIADQQAARQAALDKIAKGITETGTVEKRAAAAAKNYAKAFQDVIQPNQQMRRLMERPSMVKAMRTAQDLAKEAGVSLPWRRDHVKVQELHYVKLALDDMLKNPERFGLGKTEERAIMGTKDQLLKLIEQQSSAYAKARSVHQQLSEVLNRVQVRDTLKGKLTSPTGKETPGSYLKALDDSAQMLKKSTGYNRFENLEQVLPPKEAKVARSVAEDLERSVSGANPLQKTTLPGGGTNISKEELPHLPAMLSRPVMATNWILNKLGQESVEPKIDALATQLYLNPRLLASALSQPQGMSPQVQRMLQDLQALSIAGGASSTAQMAGRR